MTIAELEPTTTSAPIPGAHTIMKALVYHGPGKRAWEDKARPIIQDAGDAVVRITTSTICGTDLHILKGDLPVVTDGRILGHDKQSVVRRTGAPTNKWVCKGLLLLLAQASTDDLRCVQINQLTASLLVQLSL